MSLLFSNWRPVISDRPLVKIRLRIWCGMIRTSSHDWCGLKSWADWRVWFGGGRGFINGKIEVVWLADRESARIDPPASEESTDLAPTHHLGSVHFPHDEQPASVRTLDARFVQHCKLHTCHPAGESTRVAISEESGNPQFCHRREPGQSNASGHESRENYLGHHQGLSGSRSQLQHRMTQARIEGKWARHLL